MKNILWFNEIGLDHRLAVGGKGGSLGELVSAGIPIPAGFVVTTAAYNNFLEGLDPNNEIRGSTAGLNPENYEELADHCAAIRERITGAQLPDELYQEITEAYESLGGNRPVAVRSSATSEDSAEASFAGLQDTYLWVRGADEVLQWLRACWASLYNTESVAYRLRRGLPEAGLAMGVVVQTMVDARSAGVMFTRSPTSGDRSVVSLESCWGLGSSLVSGEVTPDKYTVNKVTGEIVHRAVATKSVEHVPVPGGGVETRDVEAERQTVPCLSDDCIRDLVETARHVEAHYGSPQDIEWALDKDGNIQLLQSRPETVWATREQAPVATPTERPFDHIFALLGRKSD